MQDEAVEAPEQADTVVQLASQAGAHAALQHQVQQQAAAIATLQTQLASLLQQANPTAARDTLQGPAQATSVLPDSSAVQCDISQDGNVAPIISQAVVPTEPAALTRPGMQQAAGCCTDSSLASSASQSLKADGSDNMGAADQQMMPSNAQHLMPNNDQQMMASNTGSEAKDHNGNKGRVDAGRLDVPNEAVSGQVASEQAPKARKCSKSNGRKQGGVGPRLPWLTVKWCNAPHRFL